MDYLNDSNARALYSRYKLRKPKFRSGQVTIPITDKPFKACLYVETLFRVEGFSRPERQRFINLRSARSVPRLDRSPFRW